VIVFPLSVVDGSEGLIAGTRFRASIPTMVEFTAANADKFVSHTLGRVPEGFLVVGRDGGFIVYDGSEDWTESVIVLRATDVGIARVLVF